MAEQRGVENILVILKALEKVIKDGKLVLADGKVSFADLPAVIALLSSPELMAAVEAIKQAPDEAKDISLDEVPVLVGAVLGLVKAVKG